MTDEERILKLKKSCDWLEKEQMKADLAYQQSIKEAMDKFGMDNPDDLEAEAIKLEEEANQMQKDLEELLTTTETENAELLSLVPKEVLR